MCVEEALDLIRTLPRGSMFVSKLYPQYSWSPEREAIADIQDTILQFLYGDEAKVTRPADIVARKRAVKKAEKVKKKIEETQWVEV